MLNLTSKLRSQSSNGSNLTCLAGGGLVVAGRPRARALRAPLCRTDAHALYAAPTMLLSVSEYRFVVVF